jgi:Domain of unknown function (DUF5615)
VKFLIDADLPPWMIAALAAEGHDAVHADDIGIATYPDFVVAEHARDGERCVLSGDFDFANIRNYEPAKYRGIVVLTIPRKAGSPYMRILLGKLFDYLRAGGTVDRKLLIIEADRIRVRE